MKDDDAPLVRNPLLAVRKETAICQQETSFFNFSHYLNILYLSLTH